MLSYQESCYKLESRVNNRPVKILNYLTPEKVFQLLSAAIASRTRLFTIVNKNKLVKWLIIIAIYGYFDLFSCKKLLFCLK